jgi:hypothetical protein
MSMVFLLFSSFLDYFSQFIILFIYLFGECCEPTKHRNDTLRKSHWTVTNEPNTVIIYTHAVISWIKDSRNRT